MKTRAQIARFLVVGVTAVLIDMSVYSAGLWLGLGIHPAKAIGFVAGAVLAYFANRLWTFGRARGGLSRFARFGLLYGSTLALNVAANGAVTWVLGTERPALAVAFVLATGLSATANFTGMKWLVFDA